MGKTSFNRLNHKIKSWRIGDYFRQFSIVPAGIIVTFWGIDRITEHARQKEVRATMQLIWITRFFCKFEQSLNRQLS